jgi:glyoxalase-like protein
VIELDHVLIAVSDLDAAAREVEQRHGLASVDGGRHQGLGTANRIVPLGETYLELVAVVDEAEAAQSGFGSWVAGGELPRLLGWCARTDDLDAVAGRLGLTIAEGARARPDGTTLRWRMAGLERSAEEPTLPFFIEWGAGTPYPGQALDQTATIRELRLSVSEGSPKLRSVLVDETVLDPTLWA